MKSALTTQQPLYAQIKATITRRIQDEHWPTDFQLPSEEELAGEFVTSRLTVRRALKELQSEGLLVRIQGRGTFVIGSRMQCAVFDLKDVSEEIEDGGGVHTSEVIVLEALGPQSPFAKLLQLPHGAHIFHSRIVHKEDGTPIQLEDRFVNSTEAPNYLRQDFTLITPHDYLLRETEVGTVDNTIRAIRPDADTSRLLQIDETQPCLLLDRRTWRGPVPVTRSRFVYPGDRYRLRSSHEASIQSAKAISAPFNSQPARKNR